MRVCLVYDCLFPHTVGGAERWYRNVAERLAADGHDVSYLTMRQWDRGAAPDAPAGARVVAVATRMKLYDSGGQRRVMPPLVFGFGVFAHLLRQGKRYDVVHTASFPYFSLLAAGLARRLHGYRLVVDWHEMWSREYWRDYLGRLGGQIGWGVQAACLRVPQQAFCFAQLTASRLRAEGVRGSVTVLEGEYAGPLSANHPQPAEPLVVFAGRHIPEKRAPAVVAAIARARERRPELRGLVLGDGPQRGEVLAQIRAHGLDDHVEAPGFVDSSIVESSIRRALCLLLPSSREGYGMVVVEAAAQGTPSVVVLGADNAAVELVQEGVNGTIAPDVSPEALAAAIERVASAGPELRASTSAWFAANAHRLSLAASLDVVAGAYRGGDASS